MYQIKRDPRLCPVRVVIIDRHVLFAEGLQRSLEVCEEVEAVTIATNGREAPDQVCATDPDVVLLDPWLDGDGPFVILRKLREAAPDASFLFLEDEVDEVHVRLALKLEADGFLTKSCRFQEVRQALQNVVRGFPAFGGDVQRYVVRTSRGLRFNRAAMSSPLATLTLRELEVMLLLARGLTVREAAAQLGAAVSTVDNHKSRIMRKLAIHKNVELARLAIREGLLS